MKKIVAIITLSIVVVAFPVAYAETYPQAFIVNAIDLAQDAIILMDSNGNEWVWFGIEDYYVGDIVAAIMDDSGTEVIYDDTIIMIRYSGYIEGWY